MFISSFREVNPIKIKFNNCQMAYFNAKFNF